MDRDELERFHTVWRTAWRGKDAFAVISRGASHMMTAYGKADVCVDDLVTEAVQSVVHNWLYRTN